MRPVDSSDPTPIYAQLERAIRADIAAGRLSIGDRLPTVRQLALELGVNVNTVAKVYSTLERAGVLTTRRGTGTFVRAPTESDAKRPSARERDQLLQQLSDRALSDAHAAGVSIDDLIRHLESRRSNGKD
jgi:GntR family transcriptional regulator